MTPGDEEIDPLIGRTVGGKYRIESLLGVGGMGKVYKAHHLGLQKSIAIKVLHSNFQADPQFGARFQREALAASKLDHPNVLQVLDFGVDSDGLYYIAMEYIDGQSLDRLLTGDGVPPLERTLDILSQVCAALAVAHDQGIIHRDMKPENVMIVPRRDDEGHVIDLVKVCDFGIAKMGDMRGATEGGGKTAALTAQGTVVGTPEYMSPEQARGEKLDVGADIYAVGVILYQMTTGALPFYAESAVGVLMRRLTEEVKPPSQIVQGFDPKLEAVILKAMARDRAVRHHSARELRSDMRTLRGIRGSMIPGGVPMMAGVSSQAAIAPTIAVTTPGAQPIPSVAGVSVAPGPTPPTGGVAPPRTRRTGLLVAGATVVAVLGVGVFLLTGTQAGTDPNALVPTAAPPLVEPPITAAPATVAMVNTAAPPATAAPAPEEPETSVIRRRKRGGEVEVEPATAAPPVTAAPARTSAPATTAPTRPVTTRPATAAPTGPLEARASVSGLRVEGSLTPSAVQSSLSRLQARFESCYAEAARRAGRNAAGTVNVSLTIDETGRATRVRASGDPLPGLSTCVRGVANRVSSRAPDTGVVDASFGVQFTPRGR